MLQNLLVRRFHLVLHREQRERDAFDRVVAKGGLKLDLANEPELRPRSRGAVLFGGGALFDLAPALTIPAAKPVVDRTGLAGLYFRDLLDTPLAAAPVDNSAAPPDVFTAIQSQLGLKLVNRRQRIDVLVIKSARKIPDEN